MNIIYVLLLFDVNHQNCYYFILEETMPFHNYVETKKRLKLLREMNNLTRKEVAETLNKLIGYEGEFSDEGEGLALNGINGTQVISHIEKGRRPVTPIIALAYAKIFDVTLDFIYGCVDYTKPQYKDAQEITGLSDGAIRNLENIKLKYADIEKAIDVQKGNIKIVSDKVNKSRSYTFMSLLLSDKIFWLQFNNRMNTILKLGLNTGHANYPEIMDEKNKIVAEFKELLERLCKAF